MSFTIGDFDENVAKEELGWRVRGRVNEVPVIFVLQRKTFTDRFHIRENVQEAFCDRWGHVQAACALAYERWKAQKKREPGEGTVIVLLAEHFLVD